MPYNRPGKMYYFTATKAVNHGAPVTENGFVGVAVKQQAPPFGTGPQTNPALVSIIITEKAVMITKGVVEVPNTGITSPALGDAIYIVAADNTLTKTVSTNLKYGKIVELPGGTRGPKTGFVRIDLDHKASI